LLQNHIKKKKTEEKREISVKPSMDLPKP